MKRTLLKTVWREIRRNPGRFLAIFAITALGVGFLAGLISSAPDLRHTIDSYYDTSDFMDLDIKSTAGFTPQDVDALRESGELEAVLPAAVQDTVVSHNGEDGAVARIYALGAGEEVNRTELIEGSYPQSAGECVAVVSSSFGAAEVGDTVTFSPDSAFMPQVTELTVTGLVKSPLYYSLERETSTVGNGRVALTLFIGEDTFVPEYYTDVFATVAGAREEDTFSDAYTDRIDSAVASLESLTAERTQARYDQLCAALAPYGEAAVAAVERPEWYFLGRDTNVSFVSLDGNAQKVAAVARVFPVFFFLVAALVGLTTMTRMIDEQRTEIGTMKALGYSSAAIAAKYLIYSGIASVTGGVVGLAAGLQILPRVIINAYGMMYDLPPVRLLFNPAISVTALVLLVAGIAAATLMSVFGNLREVTARLMLPKAPKSGKRILLEHIPLLWRHMSFSKKVTARNLFRYKKRLFMTVVGVAGCTALLLTGFGLRDAIGDIVGKQYGEIMRYDLTVGTAGAPSDELLSYFRENTGDFLPVHTEAAELDGQDGQYEISLYTLPDPDSVGEFLALRSRQSGEELALDADSVIVTEKFASAHEIGVGNRITLTNAAGVSAEMTVTGICENYIYHYVYLCAPHYAELFGEVPGSNTLLVQSQTDSSDKLITDLLLLPGVSSARLSDDVITTFDNMIDKIDYIVIVLILSAGLLAFVVLYSLTNINISERTKELATLKVLGFYERETAAYIFREIYLLSVLGTLVGLIFGVFLCRFVVLTAEADIVMFGREIYWSSFVLAAVITLLFTTLVSLVMRRSVKRIDMVESMKSVD